LVTALDLRAALIDDFQVTQASLAGTGSSTVPAASALGGERDLAVTTSAGTISAGVSLGVARIVGDGSASGTVELVWDGADADAGALANTGLGGVNLEAGGDNAFVIGLSILAGSPALTLTVFSGADASSVTLSPLTASELPQWVRVPFSNFAGSADFANVGAIRLACSGLASATIGLDFIRTGSTAIDTPVEALMTDVVLVDNDGNGKASAGDTLRYVVRVTNTSASPLDNVQLTVPAIPNASAPTGVALSPLANDDGVSAGSVPGDPFHTAMNTQLDVSDGDSNADLLNNDQLGLPEAAITHFGGGTLGGSVDSNPAGSEVTSAGHTLRVNADGSFRYAPATGFTGLFTFVYRLGNTAGSDLATVTLAVGRRPNAVADSYAVTGNVQIDTSTGTPEGILDNDAGDALAIALDTTGMLGSVSMSPNGQFVFTPPRGKSSGSDSFHYTVSNGFGASGPVPVTLSFDGNILWFIDGSGGAGDGRSPSPFQTLAAFNAANDGASGNPGDSHTILLRTGTYANDVATSALPLRAGQRLVGDGWSGSFDEATGFTLAPHSVVAALSGTDPVIVNATGGGIGLASGNAVYGVTVGDTPGGFGYSGAAVGVLIVQECSKTGTGGALSITTGGSFGGDVSFDRLESVASTGANLRLVGVNGTLRVLSGESGCSGSAAGSAAIQIQGGTVSLAYPAAVSKSTAGSLVSVSGGHAVGMLSFAAPLSATAGDGLQFSDADGIYAFNNKVTLNGGDAGIDIVNGSSGAFTFSDTDITNPSGAAFLVGGGNGVITHAGTVSKSSAGRLVDIQSRTGGSVTLSGGLSATGSSTGILVQNCGAGSITFGGTATTLTTGSSAAVTLSNNTGATVAFTGGGLNINTTSGTGFGATGGGTVTVTTGGQPNMIATTTGTALSVANTTIGAAGVTFRSITTTTASANAGLVLNNTGSSGGLTVTGFDGGDADTLPDAGSGGTIANKSVNQVSLTSTANVSLGGMIITGGTESGLVGTSVTGLNLSNVSLTSNGDDSADEGISIVNLLGNSTWTSVTVTGSAHNNVWIWNSSGTLTSLAVTGGSFSSTGATFGNNGLLLDVTGSAVVSGVTIDGATFSGNRATGLQILPIDNARVGNVVVQNCSFANNNIGVDFSAVSAASFQFKLLNNTLINTTRTGTGINGASHAINVFQGTPSSGLIQGRIEGNTIGNLGIAGSGSSFGNGIRVNFNATGEGRMLIHNNQIYQAPIGRGVEVIGRNGNGRLDVTVTANTINHVNLGFLPGTSDFPLAAIFVQSHETTASSPTHYTVRSDIRNNTVPSEGASDLTPGFITVVESQATPAFSNHQLVDSPPDSANATDQLTSANTGSAAANAGVSLIAGPINTPP
jgi:hypothetical protein